MMRTNDITVLLEQSERQLTEIKNEYKMSLMEKEVRPALKVLIKNYLENLRSALDYIAHDLHDSYTPCKKSHDIYFPVKDEQIKFNDAVQKQSFHDLQSRSPNAYSFLEKYQVFTNHQNTLLLKMFLLVNMKKHDQLTP